MTKHYRLSNGVAEFTYDEAKVEALGLHDLVIEKEALGPDRLPAPAKPRLPKGTPLPGSAADRRRENKSGPTSADNSKEK